MKVEFANLPRYTKHGHLVCRARKGRKECQLTALPHRGDGTLCAYHVLNGEGYFPNKLSKETPRDVYFGDKHLVEAIKFQDYRCAACGKRRLFTRNARACDHAVPLKHGGKNTRENAIALCWNCNNVKHDLLFWEPVLRVHWDEMKPEDFKKSHILNEMSLSDSAYVMEHHRSKPGATIAKELGTSAGAVRRCIVRNHGIPLTPSEAQKLKGLTADEKAYIEKWRGKKSASDIGEHLDRSITIINKYIDTLGKERLTQSESMRLRIPKETIEHILKWQNRKSLGQLAKETGLVRLTIKNIIKDDGGIPLSRLESHKMVTGLPQDEVNFILKWCQTKPIQQIADEMNRSYACVRRHIKKNGFTPVDGNRKRKSK